VGGNVVATKYVQPQVVEYGPIEKLTLGDSGFGNDFTIGGILFNQSCSLDDPVQNLICSAVVP
jgi:hypothetical protein